jgi:hypothetical protein
VEQSFAQHRNNKKAAQAKKSGIGGFHIDMAGIRYPSSPLLEASKLPLMSFHVNTVVVFPLSVSRTAFPRSKPGGGIIYYRDLSLVAVNSNV